MNSTKHTFTPFTLIKPILTAILFTLHFTQTTHGKNSNLFREYIGAEFLNVTFQDVPINPSVRFDFILAFAIDYTTVSPPEPTNGKFNIFWDTANFTPRKVIALKNRHPNVRVSLSIGGDSVFNNPANFQPESTVSWVSNAVSSLGQIIKEYNLDGIDIDYEHFKADPDTFAQCIGQLIINLKQNGLIHYASIAPYADEQVQSHYMALWEKYGHVIDYVNFQFYAYDNSTTVDEFIGYFNQQRVNYKGGKILTSFISDGSKGLPLVNGKFFEACKKLKRRNELYGIFVWCADESKKFGYRYEKQSQALLASKH